ncbi:MAG: TrbI/VirB10 family protein [Hyphomonadaceae bacterium]
MAKPSSPSRTGLDPTFDVDAPPRVAGSNSLWPITFGIVGALALGALVFLQLESSRTDTEAAARADQQAAANLATQRLAAALPIAGPSAYVPPEPLALPPAPVLPELIPLVEPEPTQLPQVTPGPTQARLDRLRAPALVIDLGTYESLGARSAKPETAGTLDPTSLSGAMSTVTNQNLSADERFAERFGLGDTSKPTKASRLGDLSTTIIEGTVIAAVLETALNSDLPGYVRAVVTRDVRGFDGSQILVPRGARLIGQYKSGVALGQSRTFVIWTRMIRPDGATIELSAPATDGLGRGGLDGDVDTHFFERFGGAVLLSLLNLGVGAAVDAGDTNIVIASTRAGVDAGAGAATSGVNVAPTVTVPQGSPVRVFVSQDLDFSTVGPVQPVSSPN